MSTISPLRNPSKYSILSGLESRPEPTATNLPSIRKRPKVKPPHTQRKIGMRNLAMRFGGRSVDIKSMLRSNEENNTSPTRLLDRTKPFFPISPN